MESDLYQLVLDAVADPLILADADGAVVLANAGAATAFDLDGARTIAGLVPLDADLEFDGAAVRALMSRYESVRGYELRRRSGSPSDVTLDIETLRASDGRTLKLLHFRAASSVRHANFWRDELVAMVSHELKNPLSAMKHSVDILLSGAPGRLTDGQRKFLGTSGRSIRRLTHLVDGFLDVSRIHAGRFEPNRREVNVPEFLGDVMQSFAALFDTRHVQIDRRVDASVGNAFLDPGMVEQVMVNLLSNAVKHTPEGGEIRVSVGPAGLESMNDEWRLLPWDELGAPRLLAIEVTDNGLGMSPETIDGIFIPFGPTPPGEAQRGEHLGLSISKSLVEAHGGWIRVDSRLGLGTTISVYLPRDRAMSCMLARLARAGEAVGHCAHSGRAAVCFVLGKRNADDWADIAQSWRETPAVNPDAPGGATSAFQLWTIDAGLAVAVRFDHGDDASVDKIFGGPFVECADECYVFGSYAVGACHAPSEAPTFAAVFNLAARRMVSAREAMEQASLGAHDSGIEYVMNEATVPSEPSGER